MQRHSRASDWIISIGVILVLMVSSVGSPALSALSQGTDAGSSVSSSSTGSYSTVPAQLPTILQEAQRLGTLNPSTPMSVQMVLPLSNPVGLSNELTELYSPSSPSYHQFFSPTQFTQLFGPSPAELGALTDYMRSKGLQVQAGDTFATNLVTFRGTAQQMEEAFKIQMGLFKYNGQSFYSALSLPQLPKTFSNVQMIYGLQNYGASASKPVPLYKILGAVKKSQTASSFVYYSPSEIRQAYNASTLYSEGYNGTGITIAIIDAYGDPYIQSELNAFDSQFNLPQTNVTVTCIDAPCDYSLGLTGWNGEIALDVEWAHAMAPGAAIDLYIGSSAGQPLYDAVLAAVENPSTNIISMSWAEPENDMASSASVAPVYGENYPWLDQVLQEAAAVGITSLASSGDWGAYEQGFGQTSPYGGAMYPSTDPYVTGVGGTSLYMNTTSGSLQFPYANATGGYGTETAWSWNNVEGGGTGGGDSTLFPRPEWQTGLGVSGGMRGAPDISWDADPQTGVIVNIEGGFWIIGGTSVGSPSLAGSLATLEQKAGEKLGLINPTLYSILNNPTEYSKAFHDITVGNNNPNSASPGWDPLTGVGSPNLGELANYLAPTGLIDVVAGSNISLGTSAPYKSQSHSTVIEITAHAFYGGANVTAGTGFADIASPNGAILGNITMSYDSGRGAWLGNYAIKSTDSPGSWTATVHITNGALSGIGSTTFSVGDGVTLFEPYTIVSPNLPYFQVGQTIPVSAIVNGTDGTVVSSGTFTTIFTFQNATGPLIGKVLLRFDPSTDQWEGSFTVPGTADQGAWVLTVNGTDSSGNRGSACSWLNVGLDVSVYAFSGPVDGQFEQTPSFVLGDNITVLALPYYASSLVSTGSFSATISSGSTVLGTIPLNFTGLAWIGTFPISPTDSIGFYNITVCGNNGLGNSGSSYTVVRVAPYSLNVNASTSSLSITDTSSLQVWASVSYPGGTVMNVGSVDGFAYLNMGGYFALVDQFPLTYNNTSGVFAAIFSSQGPYYTPPGSYVVAVSVVDPAGNSGLNFTSFGLTPPYFSLTRSSGPVGTSVTLSGSGLVASHSLNVTYDGSRIGMPAKCMTDASGNMKSGCAFKVPASVSGDHTVAVNDSTNSMAATFTVTSSISLIPSSGLAGTSVTISGSGLNPLLYLAVMYYGSSAGMPTCSSDALGNINKGCTFRVPFSVPGPHTVAVTVSDHANSPTAIFTLLTPVGVACSPSTVVVGSATTCEATVKFSGVPATGTVAWSSKSPGKFSSTSCELSKGICSAKFTPAAAGPVAIVAGYRQAPSRPLYTGEFILTVAKKASVTRVSCRPTSVAASSKTVTCKVTVTGYSPTGMVTWSQKGTGSVSFVATTCKLSKGSCSVKMTGSKPGSVTITAAYPGNSDNKGGSGTAMLTIPKVSTHTTLSCTKSTFGKGTKITCTATVSGGYPTHTGTVTWSKVPGAGSVTFSSKTCKLSAGKCSVTITATTKGNVTIEATYNGDSNNLKSTRTLILTITS